MSDPLVHRVLAPKPVESLVEHREAGGGRGWTAAVAGSPDEVLDQLAASGLRGRGGAGFPTATKWRTIRDHARSATRPTTVVVNAAEGEPGSFKDRLLLRRNPYKVLEGALIAARVVGASRVVVATKGSFRAEVTRLRGAVEEIGANAAHDGVHDIELVTGPKPYLFGEETGLLEVVAGRPPFPRVAPPWRRGVDEGAEPSEAAEATMASPGSSTEEPPTLVNNVETLAHVADIVHHGPGWFREMGRADQPGTMLCTVTGDTRRHGVVEVPVGTSITEVLQLGGGGPAADPLAVLPGVSHPLVPAARFGAGLGYGDHDNDMLHAGAGALRLFAEGTDAVAVAAGVARFLAIESCGQCTPCKHEGLALHDALRRLAANDLQPAETDGALERIADRTRSVTDGARCALAGQLQSVVAGVLEDFPEILAAHLGQLVEPVEPVFVAPLVDIEDGVAVHDERHREVQPDWSREPVWDGSYPAQAVDVRT